MTTPGKAIVIRNQRRQRWDNTHLNNVLCERNKEIKELKAKLAAERERCIKRLLELVPMTDPDLTTDYLRDELAK